jgi:uncharacterized membrane protein HdeD (DUF308 family)
MGLTGHRGRTGITPTEAMAAWVGDLHLTPDALRKTRMWLIVTGAICLITGALAIIVPIVATITTAIFIGWLLIVGGIVSGMHAWSERATGRFGWRMFNAVLTVVAGVLLVVLPLTGAITLTLLLTAWFLATGALMVFAAWRSRGEPGNGLLAVNAVASLLLGLLIAIDLPSSAAWAIGLLVGINLLFWGMRALFAAWLLKRAVPA